MFMRCTGRIKNGKEHCYWSLVENRRVRGGRIVQHTVLYLGEINAGQQEQWRRAIEVFDEERGEVEQLKLFAASPSGEALPEGVHVRLKEFSLHRPRQWGGCWLFTEVWKQLGLDEFWRKRLGASREGTDWEQVLEVLCAYRLLDPGSEWRLHRTWFDQSAMGDLLQADFALAAKDTLYRCLDQLLAHKSALFSHLSARWQDLFGLQFEVLLYDLTSTYFEITPPEDEGDKRRFGYSRDKRSDCVQVVIALVVTPEGFPLAYEVLAGNTADKTTLRGFLQKIETQYGKGGVGDDQRPVLLGIELCGPPGDKRAFADARFPEDQAHTAQGGGLLQKPEGLLDSGGAVGSTAEAFGKGDAGDAPELHGFLPGEFFSGHSELRCRLRVRC